MLDIKFIRENIDLVKKNSADRKALVDVDKLISLDESWRKLQAEVQELRSQRNKTSKTKPSPEEIANMKQVGEKISVLEEKQLDIENSLKELMIAIPNLTHKDVKVSADEDDNPVLATSGKINKFNFEAKDHVELAESLDLIDFDRATKVAGAKFYYLKNELVLLNQALIQYSLSIAMKHGFKPMLTPDLAKTSMVEGLGYNPRGESSQVYQIENNDLSLIGTAEITLGGYHADEILDLKEAPIKYVGLSHCFRTEAGSYSKFSKGIFRVHQFEKLELFIYCKPNEAEKIHDEMLKIEKEIFSGLDIPFRVIDHCTADLGTPSFRTFDLEAWLPGKPNTENGKGDWAEITSTSNCTDYQSRALNIKFVDSDGEKKLVYTLNGTAIALPRALIAIMENYQTKDGSIEIPKVLRPYLPFKKISR
ncbi:MAG: serine--tRNA ligase [Candidatus Falkowbacteria bacterium]|nr:serine--tRNA ligase [Candidatus Falkowbacteria bacterium]